MNDAQRLMLMASALACGHALHETGKGTVRVPDGSTWRVGAGFTLSGLSGDRFVVRVAAKRTVNPLLGPFVDVDLELLSMSPPRRTADAQADARTYTAEEVLDLVRTALGQKGT